MKHTLTITALAAMLGVFGAAAAQAGVGDGIASANVGLARIVPVENAQFFFGGYNFCWYDEGWQGPGWYWCGYAWRSGYGWGGGMGFHGWAHQNGAYRGAHTAIVPRVGTVRGPVRFNSVNQMGGARPGVSRVGKAPGDLIRPPK